MEPFIGFVVFVGVLYFIYRAGMKRLSTGMPKVGRGKKAQGGGDKVADWSEKIVISVLKGIGRACWKILSAPFR